MKTYLRYAFSVMLLVFLAAELHHPVMAQSSVSLLLHDVMVQTNPSLVDYDVALYFSLLDSAGNPVKDAKVEDFSLTEDQQSVQIASLALSSDEPIHVALLLDTSGSMYGEKIDAARKAAASFISRLQGNDKVAVLTFDTTTTHQIDFTRDHTAAEQVLDLIKATPGSGTCLYDAVYQTVQMTAELPAGRRAIILLTDGVDEYNGKACSLYSLDDVIRLASHGETRVPIFTIGLGSKVDSVSLDRIAGETSGRSQYAPGVTQLDALFGRLTDLLRAQYVLHYTSTGIAGEHTLALRAEHLGVQDQASIEITLPVLPYSITFVSPVEGAEVTGKVPVSITISGQGTPIQKVQFIADGESICSDTTVPFECEWDASGLEPGPVFLEAVAQDSAGNQIVRSGINITVQLAGADDTGEASGTPGSITNGAGRVASITIIILVAVAGVILLGVVVAILVIAQRRHRLEMEREQNWQATVQGKDSGAGMNDRTMDSFTPGENALGVLVILQSDDEAMVHQRIEITKSVTSFGRKADNDVIFAKDSPVSRHHAVIEERSGALFLSEVLSKDESGKAKRPAYGTFVNGSQVQESVLLHGGDEILLGKRVRIRFESVGGRQGEDDRTLDQMTPSDNEKTMDVDAR